MHTFSFKMCLITEEESKLKIERRMSEDFILINDECDVYCKCRLLFLILFSFFFFSFSFFILA